MAVTLKQAFAKVPQDSLLLHLLNSGEVRIKVGILIFDVLVS